jgi:hypothetical protein
MADIPETCSTVIFALGEALEVELKLPVDETLTRLRSEAARVPLHPKGSKGRISFARGFSDKRCPALWRLSCTKPWCLYRPLERANQQRVTARWR